MKKHTIESVEKDYKSFKMWGIIYSICAVVLLVVILFVESYNIILGILVFITTYLILCVCGIMLTNIRDLSLKLLKK